MYHSSRDLSRQTDTFMRNHYGILIFNITATAMVFLENSAHRMPGLCTARPARFHFLSRELCNFMSFITNGVLAKIIKGARKNCLDLSRFFSLFRM